MIVTRIIIQTQLKNTQKNSDDSIYVVNEDIANNFRNVVNDVWGKYKYYDGIRLSEMTHKYGTAWYKAAIAHQSFLSDSDIKIEEDFIP